MTSLSRIQSCTGTVETASKADYQSVEFYERAKVLLFTREDVALKLNR